MTSLYPPSLTKPFKKGSYLLKRYAFIFLLVVSLTFKAKLESSPLPANDLSSISLSALSLESPIFSMSVLSPLVVNANPFSLGLLFGSALNDRTTFGINANAAVGSMQLPMGLGLNATVELISGIQNINENGTVIASQDALFFNGGLIYGIGFKEVLKLDIKWGFQTRFQVLNLNGSTKNNISFDSGIQWNQPLKSTIFSTTGVVLGANQFLAITLSSNTELPSTTVFVGSYIGLLEDHLSLGLNLVNVGQWSEIGSGKWFSLHPNLNWSIIPKQLSLKLAAELPLGTADYRFSLGLSYKTDVGKFAYQGGLENLGLSQLLTYTLDVGKPRMSARFESTESKANQAQKVFAEGMMLFSTKKYDLAKIKLEEAAKLDPNNQVTKSILKKIQFIMALENDE